MAPKQAQELAAIFTHCATFEVATVGATAEAPALVMVVVPGVTALMVRVPAPRFMT